MKKWRKEENTKLHICLLFINTISLLIVHQNEQHILWFCSTWIIVQRYISMINLSYRSCCSQKSWYRCLLQSNCLFYTYSNWLRFSSFTHFVAIFLRPPRAFSQLAIYSFEHWSISFLFNERDHLIYILITYCDVFCQGFRIKFKTFLDDGTFASKLNEIIR